MVFWTTVWFSAAIGIISVLLGVLRPGQKGTWGFMSNAHYYQNPNYQADSPTMVVTNPNPSCYGHSS